MGRQGERFDGPFVVGIGGSTREGSSTGVVVRSVLEAIEKRGGETRLYAASELVLPMYGQTPECAPKLDDNSSMTSAAPAPWWSALPDTTGQFPGSSKTPSTTSRN